MPRIARYILMVAVIAGLAWFIWRSRDEFSRIIQQINPRAFWLLLGPMIAVPLASLWINAQISRDLVSEFNVKLGGLESYALSTVNALGNYLPLPQAGAMARGIYLKRVHDLPYTTYAATVVVTYISSLALTGLSGLGGLIALLLAGRATPWQLWAVFAGLSGSLLMFTPLGQFIPLPKKLALFSQGLATLRAHHILLKIIFLQLALIAVTATGLFLSARALPGGEIVSWPIALMLGLISMVAAVVNVLGTEQIAAMAVAHTLGINPALGLAASALFRLVAIAVVFTTGPFLAHWLSRRTSRKRAEGLESAPAKAPEINSGVPDAPSGVHR